MRTDDVAVAGCPSLGPHGARCQIRRGHIGAHGGIDRAGAWRTWT